MYKRHIDNYGGTIAAGTHLTGEVLHITIENRGLPKTAYANIPTALLKAWVDEALTEETTNG